jgi:UDP-GlcNAc:undecaprenyl-phosphate GlcNAc-1-phosphate transferase
MFNNFESYNFWIFGLITILSFAGFFFINRSRSLPEGLIKKIFCIYADKSTTNAMTLGGGVYAFVCVMAIFTDGLYVEKTNSINFYWVFSALVIGAYGYLDDRYEVRPLFKLIFQSLAIFILVFGFIYNYKTSFPLLTFFIFFGIGMGVLNGGNLIDGLDTLSIKINLTLFMSFYFIGYSYQIPSVSAYAVYFSLPLLSFYFFNKAPAKIYLGEIGGAFLGLNTFFLAVCTFSGLKSGGLNNYVYLLSISCFPLFIFLFEVGISFARRILNDQSPFVGDKKHLHHLLMFRYGYRPERASTVLGSLYFVIHVISFFVIRNVNAFVGIIVHLFTLITINLAIGYKNWFNQDDKEGLMELRHSGENLFLVGEDVLSDFTIEYTQQKKTA